MYIAKASRGGRSWEGSKRPNLRQKPLFFSIFFGVFFFNSDHFFVLFIVQSYEASLPIEGSDVSHWATAGATDSSCDPCWTRPANACKWLQNDSSKLKDSLEFSITLNVVGVWNLLAVLPPPCHHKQQRNKLTCLTCSESEMFIIYGILFFLKMSHL